MANTKRNNKSNQSTGKPETATGTGLVVAMRKSKANPGLMSIIKDAINAVRTVVQTVNRSEPHVQKALVGCIEHFEKHGDAMPAHRLVTGLLELNHPAAHAMCREVVDHFRTNSPIRWAVKGNKAELNVLKEGQDGYKAPNPQGAESTAYYETERAKKSRSAAATAATRSLEPATFKQMMNRTKGIINWYNKMAKGEDERPIALADKPKMVKFMTEINSVLKTFGGEEAPIKIEKAVVSEKKAA